MNLSSIRSMYVHALVSIPLGLSTSSNAILAPKNIIDRIKWNITAC